MNLLIAYAMSMLNTPYKWGGNNPLQGFDCSGLVQYVLKSAGMVPKQDFTAQKLYEYFENDSTHNTYAPGSLVFYGESINKITHVALMIDRYRVIEAAGGDHTTLTFDDAKLKDAAVRIRLVNYRPDLVAILKPKYTTIGIP